MKNVFLWYNWIKSAWIKVVFNRKKIIFKKGNDCEGKKIVSKIVEKNKPIVINKEQNTKAFVDYKYIINSEISDYSRFLLDLKWQRVKGKDYFTYQEFPVDLKTNNLSLKKRNYFILEPYDKKIIENYLIRAYSLGLLEINEKPLEIRKKLVEFI